MESQEKLLKTSQGHDENDIPDDGVAKLHISDASPTETTSSVHSKLTKILSFPAELNIMIASSLNYVDALAWSVSYRGIYSVLTDHLKLKYSKIEVASGLYLEDLLHIETWEIVKSSTRYLTCTEYSRLRPFAWFDDAQQKLFGYLRKQRVCFHEDHQWPVFDDLEKQHKIYRGGERYEVNGKLLPWCNWGQHFVEAEEIDRGCKDCRVCQTKKDADADLETMSTQAGTYSDFDERMYQSNFWIDHNTGQTTTFYPGQLFSDRLNFQGHIAPQHPFSHHGLAGVPYSINYSRYNPPFTAGSHNAIVPLDLSGYPSLQTSISLSNQQNGPTPHYSRGHVLS